MHSTDTDTQVADPRQGALVGERYRVRERLPDQDGAAVYAAMDERLERTVTLRFPDPDGPRSDGAEPGGAAAARLVHPNVVAVYDVGELDGSPFLVTEYVPGRTLGDLLARRHRLAPSEALAVTEQILAGLAAAHRAGMVHGDLHPEHVLVVEPPGDDRPANLMDSVVKVDDFGPVTEPGDTPARRGRVAAGYVAPELVTDGHADARSDVYSAGVVLFEMVTGRVPFQGADPSETAWQHVDRDVPPPSTFAVGIPAALDDLVAQATRRDPSARPTDAGAMLAEVTAARDREPATMSQMPAATAVAGDPGPDSTMVIPPVQERPQWARLPSDDAGRAGARRSRHGRSAGRDTGRSAGRDTGRRFRFPPRRRTVLIAAVAVAGLLLATGAWWVLLGRTVDTPDLRGLSGEEAAAHAERLELAVEYASPRHSDEVPLDHVLAQEPSPDARVSRDGTITLTLSLGPENLVVPDLVGASAEVARNQLEERGLVVREGEPDYSNTVPAGRVLAVDPPAGTDVRPGDEVTVSLSEGRAPVDVPSLIGSTLDQARVQLQVRGLEVTVEEVEGTRPAGEILNQDPAGGSGAEPGDTVALEVSKGPPTTPVPDVEGRRCGKAEQILTDAGFEVQVRGNRGRVEEQSPSAGTGIRQGETVTIRCRR